jgi:cellulose biosynthesis protein BcsQ
MLISVANPKGGQGKSTWSAILSAWADADLLDLDTTNGDTHAWAKKAGRSCRLVQDGVASVLKQAASDPDRWFVADCPPHDFLETRTALQVSQVVVVPLVPGGAQEARAWGRMQDALTQARVTNHGMKAAVVVNSVRQTVMAREIVAMLQAWHAPAAGCAVLGVVPQRVSIAEAFGAGQVPDEPEIKAVLQKLRAFVQG